MYTALDCGLCTHYNGRVTGLVAQINAAREKRGWSVAKLLDESGLGLERSTLHRKLHEDCPMSDEEIEACARALELTLVYVPEEARAS